MSVSIAFPERKTVLFLDNVDRTEEEDPGLLELKELSCTVFVSSRIKKLEGFRNFSVGTPRKSALGLIFRDNYERTLNMEERENLNQLLEKKLFQHPLTLRLLGKAAGARLWTLEELDGSLRLPGRKQPGTRGFGICTGGLSAVRGNCRRRKSWCGSSQSCPTGRSRELSQKCFSRAF